MREIFKKHYHVLDYEGVAKITVISSRASISWDEWLMENPKARALLHRVIYAHAVDKVSEDE